MGVGLGFRVALASSVSDSTEGAKLEPAPDAKEMRSACAGAGGQTARADMDRHGQTCTGTNRHG